MTVTIFNGQLTLDVSEEDYDFMCKYRIGDIPSADHWETEFRWTAEFVTGTGITSQMKDLWPNASKKFAEYIAELREISQLDIKKMCRDLIDQRIAEGDERYI